MLTALVGRGMSPTLRRVVLDVLLETMQRKIPLGDVSKDNIFTEVYGEIFGSLVTCLERGGDFEIIRLAQVKGADMLLINRESQEVILQECKGSLADYVKVRKDSSCLDVCLQVRNQRNKGRQQLQWPETSIITSRRVQIKNSQRSQLGALLHTEKTVVVTVVPDGRLSTYGRSIDLPPRKPCITNCVDHCLFNPKATLLCVLSSERVEGAAISMMVLEPSSICIKRVNVLSWEMPMGQWVFSSHTLFPLGGNWKYQVRYKKRQCHF